MPGGKWLYINNFYREHLIVTQIFIKILYQDYIIDFAEGFDINMQQAIV